MASPLLVICMTLECTSFGGFFFFSQKIDRRNEEKARGGARGLLRRSEEPIRVRLRPESSSVGLRWVKPLITTRRVDQEESDEIGGLKGGQQLGGIDSDNITSVDTVLFEASPDMPARAAALFAVSSHQAVAAQ